MPGPQGTLLEGDVSSLALFGYEGVPYWTGAGYMLPMFAQMPRCSATQWLLSLQLSIASWVPFLGRPLGLPDCPTWWNKKTSRTGRCLQLSTSIQK